MYWIKRHLLWILLLVGGIGLTVYGTMYRAGKIKNVDNADQNLENAINEINRILKPSQSSVDEYTGQDLRPTQENIDTARQNRGTLQDLTDVAEKKVMDEHPEPLHENPDTFRVELNKLIAELNEVALDRRVDLPSTNGNYKFSFTNLVGKTSISRDKLIPLSKQMNDVRTIFTTLAESRIKKLISIKRVPEAPDDFQALKAGYKHFLATPHGKYTNAVAVITPYAVSFTTLSRAIPKAIGKFAGYNKGLIIVRNVKVMTEEDHKNQATRMGTGGDGGGSTPFGPGAPPGTPAGAPPSAFPVPNRPNTLPGQGVPGSTTKAITVLDEKVLWVEIYLDIYRPIKKEEGPDPNAPAPAPAAPVAPAPTVN